MRKQNEGESGAKEENKASSDSNTAGQAQQQSYQPQAVNMANPLASMNPLAMMAGITSTTTNPLGAKPAGGGQQQ